MKAEKLYVEIARLIVARGNCINANNTEWTEKHESRLEYLVKQYLPSGSGIDSGVKLDLDASTKANAGKLVFTTSFHHMNENGFYDGWTEHTITLRPSLAQGYAMTISGPDRNQIKDYLHEVFSVAFSDTEWSLREEYLRQVEKRPEIKIESQWLDQCTQVWKIGADTFKTYSDAIRGALKLAGVQIDVY